MKITFKNLQNKLPVPQKRIKGLIFRALRGEQVKKKGWINFCFVDGPQIKKFNARFLKTQSSTDVLAFNLTGKEKKDIILADIIISADAALKQAKIFKTNPNYELALYAVHGLLHILGFNDHTQSQIKLMRKKESQYVN